MLPAWNIKFSIVELGNFKTTFIPNMTVGKRHPAYDDPSYPFSQVAAYFASDIALQTGGNPAICARIMYDLATGRNEKPLPMRLVVGADSYNLIHAELEETIKELETWREISELSSKEAGVDATEVIKPLRAKPEV